MHTYKIIKYALLTVLFLGLAALSVFSLQKIPQKSQPFVSSPPAVVSSVAPLKTPELPLPSPGKISQSNERMHDTSGTPTTITESGKVTGSLPSGQSLVNSPILGVEFIAPSGHNLKAGDAVCITFQRFPSGAIANLSLTEGACKK